MSEQIYLEQVCVRAMVFTLQTSEYAQLRDKTGWQYEMLEDDESDHTWEVWRKQFTYKCFASPDRSIILLCDYTDVPPLTYPTADGVRLNSLEEVDDAVRRLSGQAIAENMGCCTLN